MTAKKNSRSRQRSGLPISDMFQYMCDHIGDEVIIVDKEARIVFANKAAVRGFGQKRTRLQFKPITDYLEEKMTPEEWRAYFSKVKKRQGPDFFQVERVGKGKKVTTVEMTVTSMPYRKNDYLLAVGRDVSDKKHVEELIVENEKMKALQLFIAGTTQEIQQPLKGLMDHTHGLIERYRDRHFEYIGYKEFNDIMKTLEMMNDQVRYCFNTTERLNAFNRRKAKLANQSCNVNFIIRETVNMLKHPLQVSDIKVKLQLDPKLPPAAINALDLGQSLNNIIVNSIQSLPGEGGKVRIKTSHDRNARTVRIECKDDGVGIPHDVVSRVFDPFFTTKPRGVEKNSGLGLYIVRSIIKAHEGDIAITSHFRKGTRVAITLPVVQRKTKRRSKRPK